VGNDEYARANRSFGLTTLRDHHVAISGSKLRFQFRGKGGKIHDVVLTDRRLARIVARCQAIPGETLFQYEDEHGVRQTVDSADVNAYLREISGQDFTAKDFRTWTGTLLAVAALREVGPAATAREGKSLVLKAIDKVAEQLNNTRAVCRKYYVHPAIFETYLEGTMLKALENGNAKAAAEAAAGLREDEQAVVRLLSRQTRTAAGQ
jgi:DNA topoisomerase-1